MTLKNLIINNANISENILEEVLSGNIQLVKDGYLVMLTAKANQLPNKERILLYLCGKEAWKQLKNKGNEEILTSVSELEKNLGIKGNTLRPLLKSLKDDYKVDSNKGKYSILPQGVHSLQTSPSDSQKNGSTNRNPKSKKTTRNKKNDSVTDYIKKINNEGFFDKKRKGKEIHIKLVEKGLTSLKFSSLSSYLLPLVRKDILIREKQDTGRKQGKVWVYKKGTKHE